MEFRETLLAAQRNEQHTNKSSAESSYYKARFDPPKKEQKQKDRLSANIQKFLAKKDEEERQKKLEAQRKKDELLSMRDPKALRKIQKTLKTIKSANKSVIDDAVDHNNTAVTLQGPEQPDQDDYGYESQEAAALYEKMMEKYSKIPDEPKFPTGRAMVKKDLTTTRERVKHALQHEDDPVPHKRRRRTDHGEKEVTPPPQKESEKKRDEKPKFRKPAPPPMDFNQLLKLAEQKKSEPIEVPVKKTVKTEPEPERLMTKKQKKEYEEEMARRQRRQERIEAEKNGKKPPKEDRPSEKERKPETSGPSSFGRIPKLGDKANSSKINDLSKYSEKERDRQDRERLEKLQREKERLREKEREFERDIAERERIRMDRERLEKLKAERERIDREMERLSKDGERLDKMKSKFATKTVDRTKTEKVADKPQSGPSKKSIDLKTHNTYRIDKNANERAVSRGDSRYTNGQSSQGRPVPKSNVPTKEGLKALAKQKSDERSPKLNGHVRTEDGKRVDKGRPSQAGSSKSAMPMTNSFDFDKHVNSLSKGGGRTVKAGEARRQPQSDNRKKPKHRLESDSEYDSEMDDFIDDGDENMDYSRHIKEIFGYDKSKYRDLDDDDDPNMESSFVQVQREEYISKKHGIMEDLEDMRMEALEKQKKSKKKRRISDDDD